MPANEDDILQLGEPLYSLFRIIQPRTSITLEDLQKTSGLKALYPHIVKLYQLGMILVVEELAEKYIPKKIKLVGLNDGYRTETGLQTAFDHVVKSEKQTNLLLGYLAIAGKELPDVDPKLILARADVGKSVLQALIEKGIFKEIIREVNRMDRYGKEVEVILSLIHISEPTRPY